MVHIFYHKNCGDGLAAAYVARLRFQNAAEDDRPVRFSAIDYQAPLPEDIAEGEYCVFVDFCPKPDHVQALHLKDCKVKVINHHEGVEEELKEMKEVATEQQQYFSYVYDIDESGASLCWKHWFPTKPIPAYISYVRDIDLYNFFLYRSREVKHALYATVRDLHFLEQMALLNCWANMTQGEIATILGSRGEPIWAEICKNVDALTQPELIGRAQIGGHTVPFVFAQRHISEVGEALYTRHPDEPFVAIAQTLDNGQTRWHLRSNKYAQKPFYCFPIAQMYGGNGHRHAAGFKVASGEVKYELKTELSDTDRINTLLEGIMSSAETRPEPASPRHLDIAQLLGTAEPLKPAIALPWAIATEHGQSLGDEIFWEIWDTTQTNKVADVFYTQDIYSEDEDPFNDLAFGQAKETASFIVRACNHYHPLLKASQQTLKILVDGDVLALSKGAELLFKAIAAATGGDNAAT